MNAKPNGSSRTLTSDPRNANRGTDRGREAVVTSLRDLGAGRSIVVDREGTVIAGNKTLEAAEALGLPTRIVETSGDELLVVQRTDLLLDAEDGRARRLAYADNRTAELGLEWDLDVIQADLDAGLDFDGLWDTTELTKLLASQKQGRTDPDDVPETPEEPVSKLGDLWLLGKHRLLCGDATVVTDVERLLGGGVPPLMVTDPPYGVEYDPTWRTTATGPDGRLLSRGTHRQGDVSNDDRADWRDAWALFPGDVAYVWHGGTHARAVAESIEVCGFALRAQIIWVKQSIVIGRGHYHWRHEPCLYAVKAGRTASWIGDHKQSTIWEITNAAGNGEVDDTQTNHSTQKPVECMARPLRNHSGDVYDPFLGSGTTLIAAEMTGRVCYGIEIDPRYVDVIVKRWENFTGETAILATEGAEEGM